MVGEGGEGEPSAKLGAVEQDGRNVVHLVEILALGRGVVAAHRVRCLVGIFRDVLQLDVGLEMVRMIGNRLVNFHVSYSVGLDGRLSDQLGETLAAHVHRVAGALFHFDILGEQLGARLGTAG